ncbi:diacylglycerol kinase [Fulvimarina sp. MAC3]|uniref:diacylglycerol kinase n=1 Tax=Fulvimarina sp. MAC3 TaxID=3148887 RepID=UPI0031FC9BED
MSGAEEDVPRKLTGMAHVFAAAGYSWGGISTLWREQAFRHEILAAAVICSQHLAFSVPVWEIVLQIVLIAILLTAEALNTAIEKVVDHLSPGWSLFAKEAKDLGSAAVFFLLVANGLVAVIFWLAAFDLV